MTKSELWRRSCQLLLAALICLGIWTIAVRQELGLAEAGGVIAGLIALWLPLGLAIYGATRRQFDGALAAGTFAAIASYALTTLLYFALAVVGIWQPAVPRCFPLLQFVILVASIWRLVRAKSGQPAARPAPMFDAGAASSENGKPRGWLHVLDCVDWGLVLLLVAGGLANERYQHTFEPVTGAAAPSRLFVTGTEQCRFAALAYELTRGTPPRQQPSEAGARSSATHIFPELTLALMARYCGESDLLRAQLCLHSALISILLSLTIFTIASCGTGSRWAGYTSVALVTVLAIPWPRLISEHALDSYYFTLLPHATSCVEPLLVNFPGMASALLVAGGVMLGVAQLSLNTARGEPVGRLAIVLGMLVGALLRFRIQFGLFFIPVYLFLLCDCWRRKRETALFAAGVVALLIGAALAAEMKLPLYANESLRFQLANTRRALEPGYEWLNAWPLSWGARLAVKALPFGSPVQDWIWQILSTSMFFVCNILGLPFCIFAAVYLRSDRAWREFRLYTWMTMWLVAGSLAGAICVVAPDGDWSFGGRMLLSAGWFAFPAVGMGIWICSSACRRRWGIAPAFGHALLLGLIGAGCAWQLLRPPSRLEADIRRRHVLVGKLETEVLNQIHARLPADAVILCTPGSGIWLYSGVGGRRAYYESDREAAVRRRGGVPDPRARQIEAIWTADSPEVLCNLLRSTGATHVVELPGRELRIHPTTCLEHVWSNPNGKALIMKIR